MADALQDAQERYSDALGEMQDQRAQISEDLRFSDPSDPQQWDENEKRQRETDPGGMRPCLVMDQTGQYVANVAGQVEQRPPAIHAIPVGDGADKKVAEHLDGFYRHIEHSSRAQQHYARALTSAARAGVGYLIVRPEFTDRAMGYQEPRISSEGDPLRVLLDPWSVELDGSDANWGQLLTPLSHREFARQFGTKRAKVSFGDEDQKSSTDDRESVLVAEDWKIVDETRNMIFCVDPSDPTKDVFALPEDEFWEQQKRGGAVAAQDSSGRQTYKDKYRCVKWSRMSGVDILTAETEYPASGIGIVPLYGYVGGSDGRMKYCGIPRRAREPQRAYNYHISEIRAYMGQAPKAPVWLPARAARGFESLWDRASVDSRAWLPYNDLDSEGAIQAPQRAPIAANLQNHIQSAEQARQDIQAALGMYQASLGAPSNETSGVAIEQRKQQGESATAHFPSHLAASLGQVGKLCMDMIPRLIDTRRQMRILGIDMTPGKVIIDPKQPQALAETDQGISINPNVGKYDVRVVVGASFSTQRQQAQEAYTEMMRANPQMMPAIAPLWAQTLDVPHADKLAQVLTAMAPDAVKAILQPDQQDSPAALKAENDQLKQALQEAVQHAKDAQMDADEAHAQLQDKSLEHSVKVDDIAIRDYDAQTKRLVALGATITHEQVVQLTQQTIAQAMTQPDPSEQEGAQPMQPAAQPAQPEQQEPAMQEQQEPPGPAPEIQELMQGQEHLAQLMEMLIHAVQAPRKRTPVRDQKGDILHVIDTVDRPQTQEAQQ